MYSKQYIIKSDERWGEKSEMKETRRSRGKKELKNNGETVMNNVAKFHRDMRLQDHNLLHVSFVVLAYSCFDLIHF